MNQKLFKWNTKVSSEEYKCPWFHQSSVPQPPAHSTSQPSIRHFIPHAQADITDTRSAPPRSTPKKAELFASSFQKVETFVTTLSRSSLASLLLDWNGWLGIRECPSPDVVVLQLFIFYSNIIICERNEHKKVQNGLFKHNNDKGFNSLCSSSLKSELI